MESPIMEVIFDPQTTANTYVLIENGSALIIDPNHAGRIREVLERCHAVPELVLLTHEHADHISGLNDLRGEYQFRTVASTICSERMQNMRSNLSRIFGVYLIFVTGERVRDYPRFTCESADVTFDEAYACSWQGHKIEMTLTPGHSPGSAAILIDDRMLFSGDSLLGDREVVVRFEGGSEEDWVRGAKPYYEALPDTVVCYPGHGDAFPIRQGVFDVAHPQVEE